MAIGDFNKKKKIEVTSTNDSGSTISLGQPITLVDGNDSTTGTGSLIIDFTNISSELDIAVYDENDNLLDYTIEEFNSGGPIVLHVYDDFVRNDTVQLQIAYGNGSNDQSDPTSTIFDKESNLQAGYLLNESSGDALDVTSNNNDGTVNAGVGIYDATGQVDSAYDFDGTDDYMQVSIDSTKWNDPYSWSFWIKSTSTAGIWWGGIFDSGPNDRTRIGHGIITPDKITFNRFTTNPTSTTSINDGSWHHIVMTYAGTSDGTMKLYVDGVEEDSGTNTDSFSTSAKDLWEINRAVDSGDYVAATWDDVRIYDRALSSSEIQAKFDVSKDSQIFFSQQAAESTGTDITYSATAQTITATEKAPSTNYDYKVSASSVSITTNKLGPTVYFDMTISATTQTITEAEQAPTQNFDYEYSASKVGLTEDIINPTVGLPEAITINMNTLKLGIKNKIPLINRIRLKGTAGEKEIERDWPNEEGLEARINTQEGRKMNLKPHKDLRKNKDDEGL